MVVDHVEAERDGGLPCASGVKWRTRLYEVERGMCMWVKWLYERMRNR